MKPNLSSLRLKDKVLRGRSFQMYLALLRALCRQHGNLSFVQTLNQKIDRRDWAGLLSYADSLSSQLYDDATTHFVANQFASLIRKYPWTPSDVSTDPEGAALRKWVKSEHMCKRVNQRFSLFQFYRSPYEGALERVRGFIRYVLGDSPNMERIYQGCDFTAGASVGVHGNATNLGRKLSSDWSVSPSAYGYYFDALCANDGFQRLLCEEREVHGAHIACYDPIVMFNNYRGKAKVVPHNKIGFVPKTAKTLRSIAVEPVGNGFLQKGVDVEMRKLLKNVGIDLSDQSRNQFFAKFGSEDWVKPNCFCTIDLSSASDSIATEMCRSVLPPDWFDFLNEIRSQRYHLNGSTHSYEKFCSMGNGFCFPLESLIFAAICSAAGCGIPRRDFLVYGDDIVVRKDHFTNVISLLKIFGFTPNHEKTFSEGPFRESCGADWYEGEDVRPYTLDHKLDSCQNLYKFLNLSRRNTRTSEFFAGIYPMVIGWLPVQFRFFRPYGPPDSGIDLDGLEYIVSPLINLNRKDGMFRWYEVISSPAMDRKGLTETVRVLCALRGDTTLYLRRRNVNRIARKRGG